MALYPLRNVKDMLEKRKTPGPGIFAGGIGYSDIVGSETNFLNE
jgi:hypothetical protein